MIEQIGALLGPEARIGGVGSLGAEAEVSTAGTADAAGGGGFGSLLAGKIDELNQVQAEADHQQQLLATGQVDDISSVVVAAERAQLALQLATGVRNKLVDAYSELMRTQV